MKDASKCDKIQTNDGWLLCPRCGRGKVLKLLPTTVVTDLEVHCKICKQKSVVNIPKEPEP